MNAWRWSCALLAAVLLPDLVSAQEQRKLVPALGWDRAKQGAFVTAVAVDLQNNVWAGTEGNGLWRYDARAKKWTQFNVKDGLGDDCVYALAVDKLGRVWAGHLNHGVSVFNGAKWKNYDILDGPPGSRVFAISACGNQPEIYSNDDVWIGTDNGLARYSLSKDDWEYSTRADGLPSNQVDSIGFDQQGNIIIGTQCDGVGLGGRGNPGEPWYNYAGPLHSPNAFAGMGLPSNLINVAEAPDAGGDADLFAATPYGIAVAVNYFDWYFKQGADWKANVDGLYDSKVKPVDNSDNAVPQLAETWVTCYAQDWQFQQWFGYRTKGVDVLAERTPKILFRAGNDSNSYFVRGMAFPKKGPPLVAVYDIHVGGLLTLDNNHDELVPGDAPPKSPLPFPSPAKPPTLARLTALAVQLELLKNRVKVPDAIFLGDDWRTQGDWVGRYGSVYANLCGVDSGVYLPSGTYRPLQDFNASVEIGPHNKEQSTEARPFVAVANTTDRRALYSPTLGHRIEAEVNDFSSDAGVYPLPWEGPDLWVVVIVPYGADACRLSLYFTNNDAHRGSDTNKLRDYDVQVLPYADDREIVQNSAPLARARVTDFWGGVYKQFVVTGPAVYVVRIGRNHSSGTKLQGIFLDNISPPVPQEQAAAAQANAGPFKLPYPGFDSVAYHQPEVKDKKDKSAIEGNALVSAASRLWDALDASTDKVDAAGMQLPYRVLAYRAAAAGHAPATLLSAWRWQMGMWTDGDRADFDKATAAAYSASVKPHPAQGAARGN